MQPFIDLLTVLYFIYDKSWKSVGRDSVIYVNFVEVGRKNYTKVSALSIVVARFPDFSRVS